MRFVTYLDKGTELVGVLSPDGTHVHALREWNPACSGMINFIAHYSERAAASITDFISRHTGTPLESVQLLAPIPQPAHDLICVGQNYLEHALESARFKGIEYQKPDVPVYFSKRVNRAVAHGGEIPSHRDITSKLDYETELAVVIGTRCDHVAAQDAYRHIFGYTVANDVSARDLQSAHAQFYVGKGLDGFAPMGPWIVTADEFAEPANLQVITRVNGEVRQNANTSEFIFDIPYMISQLSAGMVLEPGDILLTGTPSGVGMGFSPPRFLSAGDVVECEIQGIGVLRNTVR